jgi:twitching motility protein PilT
MNDEMRKTDDQKSIDPNGLNLHQLLKVMLEKGASDLHITAGTAPVIRVDGAVVPLKMPPLSPSDCKKLCYGILTDQQKSRFEEENELDLSFGVKGLARFRANIFVQRGVISGAFRQIPFRISGFSELGLPNVVADIAAKPRGLVLVTGPTGSGKSTTLASIIDKINRETHQHILTIEDPVEFLHPHKNCIVNQREVFTDTDSYSKALKYITPDEKKRLDGVVQEAIKNQILEKEKVNELND